MRKELHYPMSSDVKEAFSAFPPEFRSKLMVLRQLIFETASALEAVGEVKETLKWGEPSYLTSKSKAGSTIRIAWKEKLKDQYSIFFKCTANLVPAFKEKYPDLFEYGGNRSINFKLTDEIPVKELKQCIALALSYHRNKNMKDTERWDFVSSIS